MNAPHSPDLRLTNFITTQWGIPPEYITTSLEQQATFAADPHPVRIGQVIARAGLATQEEIDRLLLNKPTNVLTLSYLFEHIDGLRAQSQRLLAANDRLAYLDAIHPNQLHPDYQSNPGLRALCEEMSILPLVSTTPAHIRFVFASYDTYKNYMQLGRLERSQDAIGQLVTEDNKPITPFWSLGNRDQISPLLQQDASAAFEAADEDQLNVWQDPNTFTSAESTTNQKLLADIIARAAAMRSSNIQFKPDDNGMVSVRYRLYGDMIPAPHHRPLTPAQAEEMQRFLHVKSHARYNDSNKRVEGRLLAPADGQFIFQSNTSQTFLRCAFAPPSNHGIGHAPELISLRLMPHETVSIDLIDYNIKPPIIRLLQELIAVDEGLVLLVGPTSSGKSTTIAGMINEHDRYFGDTRNRLSLEHPVERQLRNITQLNVHKSQFELYMAALLRHDPDLIWIGEIRDRATAATCIRSANTGHMVFSTLHANNAATAYGALLAYIRNPLGTSAESVMVTAMDTVDALSLIVAQRLVPQLCPSCRVPLHSDNHRRHQFALKYRQYCAHHGISQNAVDDVPFFTNNPNGCTNHPRCFNGYIGELPINEYIYINYQLRKQLRDNANNNVHDTALLESSRPFTLHDSALNLAIAGQINVFNIFRV